MKALGVFLNGKAIPNPNPRGEAVSDDKFYLIFNAHKKAMDFILPRVEWGEVWIKDLDTAAGWLESEETLNAGAGITLEANSLVVLRRAA